jgi:protein-disulfide isomerase
VRLFLLILAGGLIAVGVLLAVQWTAPGRVVAAKTSVYGDAGAIGSMVRDYILANPEVLVEAMQELEKKHESQRESVAQNAITKYESELLRDSDSPVAGNSNGDVIIVEFMDYQCGYCKHAYNIVKSVVAADGNVKIIYKDYPILGDASRFAAHAVLAAGRQNKYLPLHNALMEFRGKLDRARVFEIATSVGIDMPQLSKDMEASEIKQVVERNLALGSALGIRGTPAFVIGKQLVPGAVDAATLKKLLAETRRAGRSIGSQ